MKCRHCGFALRGPFLDLGFAPPSNAYRDESDLTKPEVHYPLRLRVCDACWLVQTEDYSRADELFSADYAYFSSVSRSWVAHAARYCSEMTERFGLGRDSLVVEVASNDGYLLRNFVAAGIPCLGVEPTASTAAAAEALGIPVCRDFFGEVLARHLAADGRRADLIVGNNVYAHVPDINDFTAGLSVLLKPGGVITLEFPHLMRLMQGTQFDTVYHEHYSYLSLYTVGRIFAESGLRIFDVAELSTHGGSLRVFGCHASDARPESGAVSAMLAAEHAAGLRNMDTYVRFQSSADRVKDGLLEFLLSLKRQRARVVAYGAAAKGNTLLNYAGVRRDLLPVVYDAAPSKQGRYLPGSHIPICAPDRLRSERPDFVLILPWNIGEEVAEQLEYVREWGGKFATAVPGLRIW